MKSTTKNKIESSKRTMNDDSQKNTIKKYSLIDAILNADSKKSNNNG